MNDIEYEHCLDKTTEIQTLDELLFGVQVPEIKKAEDYWLGMPSFNSKDNTPWKQLLVNFQNEEDYKSFAKLINTKLTEKTKSIWFPEKEYTGNGLMVYIDEQ